jgi:hypothetical protein
MRYKAPFASKENVIRSIVDLLTKVSIQQERVNSIDIGFNAGLVRANRHGNTRWVLPNIRLMPRTEDTMDPFE